DAHGTKAVPPPTGPEGVSGAGALGRRRVPQRERADRVRAAEGAGGGPPDAGRGPRTARPAPAALGRRRLLLLGAGQRVLDRLQDDRILFAAGRAPERPDRI